MSNNIRRDFLQAIHASLHDVAYTVIGGAALAEHGSARRTADVDVLVGEGVSKGSAETLLVRRSNGKIIRLGQGKLGFVASNGGLFQLDLTTDQDVDLPFDVQRDTQVIRGGRVATMTFLLNSKAHAWQTRVPFEHDYEAKKWKDAQDITFCLQALRGSRNIDRSRLNWVYTNQFWTPFLSQNRGAEQFFRAAGLWTDQNEFSSGSSLSDRSSRSDWSSLGSWNSQPGSVGSHEDSLQSSRQNSRQNSRRSSHRSSRQSSRQSSMNSIGSRRSNWSEQGGGGADTVAVH